jgi:hypothetical protein
MMPDWGHVLDCLAGGILFMLFAWVVRSDREEITRRCRQAGQLLAAVGPCFVAACLAWACRGRAPGPAHPAVQAARGWGRLSDDAARELEDLEFAWRLPAVTDTERVTPRGEAS